MKSIIVGTAGHIDHGKTALVKALTGIDADRLQEEKRRGITIDLGFAHLELPGLNGETLLFGFVDVPGHERFVRNMLAGVSGIDLVLLVIAADEGIKPQTREHFDICRLLSVPRGITVLTKSDLVDADTREVVHLEIEDLVRGSFLDSAHSPIVPVSSLTGAGLEDLRHALVKIAGEVRGKDSSALARLPIDRVFTMKGFGTVVTGTLISGAIHKEEELEVLPGGRPVRVRGVQVHGKAAGEAIAGQRTALNLAGASIEHLARGMVLSPPATFQPAARIDVSLTLLPPAKPLKDRARVHLHVHAAQTIATVPLVGRKQAAPGETAFARLRLADPVLVLPGDRFILRQFSPLATIGGGVILDAAPIGKSIKRQSEEFLKILAEPDAAKILKARVSRRGDQGLTLTQAVAETGWRREVIESYLKPDREIVRVGDVLIQASAIRGVLQRMVETVSRFQQQNPLVAGMATETLRKSFGASDRVFDFALGSLLEAGKLQSAGDLVHLPGRGVVMKNDEAESRKMIEHAFASAGLKVPALKQVLAGLKIDRARGQKIVTLLLREKILIKVSDDLVFHQAALAVLRKDLAAYKLRSPKIDVAGFKDLTGVSRKYAIPLLEYLDRERVTRREGDQRVIF